MAQRAWQTSALRLRGGPDRRAVRRLAGPLLLALASLAGGCAGPGDPSPPLSLRRDLPEDSTLRLPDVEPPALVDAGLSSGDGTPIVSFYSLNQPIVSVCQAPLDPCLRLLPTARVVPRADAQTGVTVLIEAQETGVQMTLSDELLRFWTEVDLVAGRPAWLASGDQP